MGDNGDEWEFERIGTEREKMQVEREIHDIRDRLAKVDEWKKRHADIERELASVWVEGGEAPLAGPSYAATTSDDGGAAAKEEAEVVESESGVTPSYADVSREEAEEEEESVDEKFEESLEEIVGDESMEAL